MPLISHRESAAPLEMKSLVEEARKAVEGGLSADAHAKAALANIIRVGISAGGARAKAVVAWNPATNQIRSGQFDIASGFEPWIVKFDGIGKDFELWNGWRLRPYGICLPQDGDTGGNCDVTVPAA
jgi:serine/threonine-protein kinase HipA